MKAKFAAMDAEGETEALGGEKMQRRLFSYTNSVHALVQEWREHRHKWASYAFTDTVYAQTVQAAAAWAEIAKDLGAMREAQRSVGTEPD
jgi:hypothetical protein